MILQYAFEAVTEVKRIVNDTIHSGASLGKTANTRPFTRSSSKNYKETVFFKLKVSNYRTYTIVIIGYI